MSPKIVDGWLVVPYVGHEMASVFLNATGEWRPAFLDWVSGQRVAKIRVPALSGRSVTVRMRVNDVETVVGRLS